jgi:hypothetical protein
MECSIKTRFSIQKNLESILKKEFTESNIKELLMDIREFISNNSILRDMADFMAHPIRDKGLCQSDIDLFHTKLKFTIPKNAEKLDIVNIPEKLYNTLLKNGVEKINEVDLIKYAGINKRKFQEILKKNYKLRNKKAILENRFMYNEMIKGINYLIGSIENKSVFSQEEFIGELISTINILQEEFKIIGEYSKAIEDNSNDIMVCLISLLHDAKITLFNNEVGKLYISLVPNKELIEKKTFNEILIGLFARFEIEKGSFIDIAYCIIDTKAKASDYIESFEFDEKKGYELTEIVTSRKNGKLILEEIK